MTSMGKTPVIVSVANRPAIMFLVIWVHHLFLTSGSFSLWSVLEEPFFITFCNQQIEYGGSGKTRRDREPALSC